VLKTADILIVDDQRINLILLRGILRDLGLNIVEAESGDEALAKISQHDFALVLLDVMMPHMDGFETALRIRAEPRTQHVPIIFVTGISKEQQHIFRGYETGAVDYLFKPVDPEILISKVKVFVDLHLQRMALETTTRELENTVAELKKSQDALHHNSLHDALTGLPNRRYLLERIGQALIRAQRREAYFFGLICIDIDRFKLINESYGHSFGDQLLVEFKNRLLQCLRPLDTLSRLGSDEFLLLLEELSAPRDAVTTAKRIRLALSAPFHIDGKALQISASFGILVSPADFDQPEDVIRSATIAMYKAKEGGRDRFKVFHHRMLTQAMELMTLETDLRRAVVENEFFLHFQPILRLADKQLVGVEALVRWNHPQRGMVMPGSFIHLAEDTGLIVNLGRIVFQEACIALASWLERDLLPPGFRISVNISGRQFRQPDLVEFMRRTLESWQVPANRIKAEITETVIMENAPGAVDKLNKLKELGITLSIDDFGTGYSSMSYLQRFPLDNLKIDLSFVRMMDVAPENIEIVKAIINLAHNLGLEVVAEGVETVLQEQTLMGLRCDYAQGFLYSKPLNRRDAEAFMAAWAAKANPDEAKSA